MFEEAISSRLFPLLAVILIVATIILTGPLAIGTGNLSDTSTGQIGGGEANVTIIQPPTSSVWLKRGEYGSGQYTLEVPDTKVHVSSVTGSPLLNYKIQITSLGYAKTSLTMLNPSSEGRHRLSIPLTTIDPSLVKNDSYRGELFIILRANETRTLYQENVTVHVER